MTDNAAMRTYEITFSNRGPMRVTIPETWKVTYGAVVPGKPVSASSGPYGLRLWEGTDRQRAIFTNVESFRDLSIETQVAAVRKYGTEEWYADDGVTWTGSRADLVEKGWRSESDITAGEPPWKKEALGMVVDKDDAIPFDGGEVIRKSLRTRVW